MTQVVECLAIPLSFLVIIDLPFWPYLSSSAPLYPELSPSLTL